MATLRAENSGGAAVSSLQAGAALHPVDYLSASGQMPSGDTQRGSTGSHQTCQQARDAISAHPMGCPTAPEQEELPHKQLAERAVGRRPAPARNLHAAQHLRGTGTLQEAVRLGWLVQLADRLVQIGLASVQQPAAACVACGSGAAALATTMPRYNMRFLTCSSGLQLSKKTSMAMPNSASLLAYTPAQEWTAGVCIAAGGRKPDSRMLCSSNCSLRRLACPGCQPDKPCPRRTKPCPASTMPTAPHLSRSRRCPQGGAPA